MTMTPDKIDLSHIDNMEELKAEINNVHKRVKFREKDLNERLNRLPHESIKATVSNVVPSVISSFLPGKSASLITGGLGLLLGKGNFEKGSWKAKAANIAKEVSLYTLIKGAYHLWAKRKSTGK